MKWVRAVLYTIVFFVLYIGASLALAITGLDVAVARLFVNSRMTYSAAYQLLRNTNIAMALLITIGLVLCMYAIRNPGRLAVKFARFKEWLREATAGRLVIIWVVAAFTVVGYVAAIYATWHFAAKRMAARTSLPTPDTALVARLAELDSAQRAGLITVTEHEAKRAEILQAY